MSALAEVLVSFGGIVEGSDSSEVFYTDELLNDLHISVCALDDMEAVRKPYDCVVYSAAYNPNTQKQLQYFQTRGISPLTYPQVWGGISRHVFSIAVAGVHGKTTISGMSATLAQQLSLNGVCVVGGQIHSLHNRSAYIHGTEFFLAETCEYRRHFLYFHPNILVVPNIELDHQDYFKDESDTFSAFFELAQQIKRDGALVYCHDDPLTLRLVRELMMVRNDIQLVPYGRSAPGEFGIVSEEAQKSGMKFSVKKWADVSLGIPLLGMHMVLNAVAALATIDTLHSTLYNRPIDMRGVMKALSEYRGAKRRMETVGIVNDITIADDYAHHPTAIKATLAAFRQSGNYRRIIADFMSHTHSRTRSLLDQFALAFDDADIVVTHDVYPSARDTGTKKISGRQFANALSAHHDHVHYFSHPLEAKQFCMNTIRSGDLFITMGAGDNWKLGRAMHRELTEA